LVIINVLGARVKTLVNSAEAAGEHSVVWDGRNDAGAQVSSGIYFYRMTAAGATETRKMVMMK
jgi:flagellar hook assembly protein FlgD